MFSLFPRKAIRWMVCLTASGFLETQKDRSSIKIKQFYEALEIRFIVFHLNI